MYVIAWFWILLASLLLLVNFYIRPIVHNAYNNTLQWQSINHWLIDYNLIKKWYTFTWIVCNDFFTKCLDDNNIIFYDTNWKIKTKYIVYFLNNNISFNFTGEWYKSINNIQELYNKTRFYIYLPEKPILKFSRYNYLNKENKFSDIINTIYFKKP